MKRLKWACIGVGAYSSLRGGVNAIAYAHAEALTRNAAAFELVAGASLERRNLDDFAREYPCRGYLDMDELFAKEKPDGCTISTWAPAREEHVLAAIRAGVKSVLIEKPLSLTMAAADRMKAAADKAGARLFVNFQRRYGRPFALVKEAVGKGRLGKVESIELMQPCANALDFGPHFVNMALYFLGSPKAETILAGAEGLESVPWHGLKVEKAMTATVFLSDGVKLFYSATPANRWEDAVIRVNGTDGFAELFCNTPPGAKGVVRIVTADGVEAPALDENFHHGDADPYLYFERAYADLAEAIATGRPCRLDFGEGYATQAVLLGVYDAAKRARE